MMFFSLIFILRNTILFIREAGAMKIDENIYQLIVENVNQEIFVCDADANIIFANPASIEINELDAKNVIGRNVRDLVKEGYFNESITLKVLKEKKPLNMLMRVKSGKEILEVANPVFDENGNIKMVVCTSSDFESVTNLLETLEKQNAQIQSLKHELSEGSLPAAEGPASENTRALIEKASLVDVPVYISGESGTGKLNVARTIARSGLRREAPVISVRCSGLSHDDLDRDIFGEERIQNGKTCITKGKLELADKGTLIVSEMEQLPERLQAKFSSFIRSKNFTRAGSSRSVSCDVRIIGLTTDSLASLNPSFFQGLAAIQIPLMSLNDRKQDISSLCRIYLSECNAKYKDRKILANSAIGILTAYSWPGNLTEFSQVIESAYALTEGHIILGETIHSIIYGSSDVNDNSVVICTDLIPLKEAKHQLEEQLVKKAISRYKTTYKAAEALGVDQSTVSKLLKKYK